jgi:predicted deacetylase
MTRALVVSIHDVSPFARREVDAMLDELRRVGVERTSLLVVPDYHHRGRSLESPEFVKWLQERRQSGHEIVIHGYCHQRQRRPSDRGWKKLMTRVYTEDEGEFYDIGREEARALVERALGEFKRAGFSPTGFIAPAWLLSPDAERALMDLDFEYTTRLAALFDLRRGVRHDSQSLVYSVRNTWRRIVSRRWNACLFRALRDNPLLRISLHPPDYAFRPIWRQICGFIRRALEDRKPMTYESWIHAQRCP